MVINHRLKEKRHFNYAKYFVHITRFDKILIAIKKEKRVSNQIKSSQIKEWIHRKSTWRILCKRL